MPISKRNAINARQIKAARALLDWSQEDLASASGLSIATIRKIESGALSPRDKTMGAIVSALEEANIEFTDSTGVRLNTHEMSVIDNGECFLRLLETIFHEMKGRNGEVLFMNSDSSRMDSAEWEVMLRIRADGVKVRLLTYEGNTKLNLPLDEYRWVPKSFYRYNVLTIYRDKVAISVYRKHTDKNMDRVIIIKNEALAESLRNSFNFMWDNCRKPTLTTAPQVFE